MSHLLSLCVCVCVYIYIYIYTYTHTHTCIHHVCTARKDMKARFEHAGYGHDSRARVALSWRQVLQLLHAVRAWRHCEYIILSQQDWFWEFRIHVECYLHTLHLHSWWFHCRCSSNVLCSHPCIVFPHDKYRSKCSWPQTLKQMFPANMWSFSMHLV